MEIFNNLNKAFNCAIKRFTRQKSDEPIFICRAIVARKEFWTVLSHAELKANKLSARHSWTIVDGQHGLLEHKHHIQSIKSDKYCLTATALRGYSQYQKATEKLKKMERGANAPERPTKLDTTEA